MRLDPLVVITIFGGALTFMAQLMYLNGVGLLRADLGIQVSGFFLVIWAVLVCALLLKRGWRYWWVAALTSPALIGPYLYFSLVVGCAIDQTNCP